MPECQACSDLAYTRKVTHFAPESLTHFMPESLTHFIPES